MANAIVGVYIYIAWKELEEENKGAEASEDTQKDK